MRLGSCDSVSLTSFLSPCVTTVGKMGVTGGSTCEAILCRSALGVKFADVTSPAHG